MTPNFDLNISQSNHYTISNFKNNLKKIIFWNLKIIVNRLAFQDIEC